MIFTIPGQLYSSKNSRQVFRAANGRTYVVKSEAAKADEVELFNKLLCIKQKFRTVAKRFAKPYHIRFKIYRKTAGRFDYVNIIQNLCDSMVKAGLLDDDDANNLLPVFDEYKVDREKPRVEFEIIGKRL